MKVHCLFEQSGTFKKTFKELGYEAYDYDIENRFNETDYEVDLFQEINNAYDKKPSIFDFIGKEDLIVAFFPCTHFSVQNDLVYSKKIPQFKNWDDKKINDYLNQRKENRKEYFKTFLRFVDVVKQKEIPTIIENPYNGNYLLKQEEVKKPNIVIKDRTQYGDFYVKPTMFYFYNLEPTYFSTHTKITNKKTKRANDQTTVNRSMIHPEFALNFINKYIFGK